MDSKDFGAYKSQSEEDRLFQLLIIAVERHEVTKSSINTQGKELTIQDIKNITSSIFGDFAVVDKKIIASVKASIKKLARMDSLDYPNKVIACVSKVLNILIKNEENGKVQTRLTGELKRLEKYQAKINDIFSLKSAIIGHKDLMPILEDDTFLKAFAKLRTFYGSNQEIAPEVLLSLVQLWSNPQIQHTFKKFIEDASFLMDARIKGSVDNLISIEFALKHNGIIHNKKELYYKCEKIFEQTFGSLKGVFDQIIDRVMIKDLNEKELDILFNLLNKCIDFVSRHSDPKKLWQSIKLNDHSIFNKKIKEEDRGIHGLIPDEEVALTYNMEGMLPVEVASVLDQFDEEIANQPSFPHLYSLTEEQKFALVEKAFQFAFNIK